MATEDIRERLAQLPHHAVVAFAARCARRVQPLTHVLPQQGRDVIDRRSRAPRRSRKVPRRLGRPSRRRAARAADARRRRRHAPGRRAPTPPASPPRADARADAAATPCRAAAAAAAWAASQRRRRRRLGRPRRQRRRAAARAAAASDLDRLIALNPGEPDALGAPIDPSEAGPLGPLWPQGVPEWYTEAATATGTPHDEPSGDAD